MEDDYQLIIDFSAFGPVLPVPDFFSFNIYFQLGQTRYTATMSLIQFHKHLRSVSPHRHINIRALYAAIGHLNVVAGNRDITDAIIRGDLCNNSSSVYTYSKAGLKTLEGGIVKERSEDSQMLHSSCYSDYLCISSQNSSFSKFPLTAL